MTHLTLVVSERVSRIKLRGALLPNRAGAFWLSYLGLLASSLCWLVAGKL